MKITLHGVSMKNKKPHSQEYDFKTFCSCGRVLETNESTICDRCQRKLDANIKLKKLADLKDNWDSYGAIPIKKLSIIKAGELLEKLDYNFIIVPTSDGGIQLEQHKDGYDIEIYVNTDD